MTHAQIRRRTLAKGAAWAAPTVAMALTAPALAASSNPVDVGGTICQLHYGAAGTDSSFQAHKISLGVISSTDYVPKGTVLNWQIAITPNAGNGYHELPDTDYSQNARWALTLSPAEDTTAALFTVTLTVNADGVAVGELNCVPTLIWDDTHKIAGGTTLAITSTTSGPPFVNGVSSGLTYRVAKRAPVNVNQGGRLPHYYDSRSGGQTCFPKIIYRAGGATSIRECAVGKNDSSTIYDGDPKTCARIDPLPPSNSKIDYTLPEKC